MCLVHYCCFCLGSIWSYFFTRKLYLLFFNISISLNFLSNSLRSFFSSPTLFLGVGQRLKKYYLLPLCLTLSIIRFRSRVTWSNPWKGVAFSPTRWCTKLSKREPSGHPRLKGENFTYFTYIRMGLFCFVWSRMCSS